jgi:peptidylprolyl isomerase
MRTAQQGDRVKVHYVKRLEGGTVAFCQSRKTLELTVGVPHPQLPGLGLALVGLAPGMSTTLLVPAAEAYGLRDPGRIYRLARTRFPKQPPLALGKWRRITDRRGRRRLIRILEERGPVVIVDNNHPWAGQALNLQVELIRIQDPEARPNDRKGEES